MLKRYGTKRATGRMKLRADQKGNDAADGRQCVPVPPHAAIIAYTT
jgi:hypothetical protein